METTDTVLVLERVSLPPPPQPPAQAQIADASSPQYSPIGSQRLNPDEFYEQLRVRLAKIGFFDEDLNTELLKERWRAALRSQ